MGRRESGLDDDAEPLETISLEPPEPPGPPEPPMIILSRRSRIVSALLALSTVAILVVSGTGASRGLDVASLHLKRSVAVPFGIDNLPKTAAVYRAVPDVNVKTIRRIADVIGLKGEVVRNGHTYSVRDANGSLNVQDDGTTWFSRLWPPEPLQQLPVRQGVALTAAQWKITTSRGRIDRLEGRLVRLEAVGRVQLISARAAFDTLTEANPSILMSEKIERVEVHLVDRFTQDGASVFVPTYAFILQGKPPIEILAVDDRAFAGDDSASTSTTTTTVNPCAPSPSSTDDSCSGIERSPVRVVPGSDSSGFTPRG